MMNALVGPTGVEEVNKGADRSSNPGKGKALVSETLTAVMNELILEKNPTFGIKFLLQSLKMNRESSF